MSAPPPLPPENVHQPKKGMHGCAIAALIVLPVIFVVGILAALATPAYNGIRQSGMRTKSINNARQIALGLRIYATDYDGEYPKDRDGKPFTSSQDAFDILMPDYIDTESVFWVQTKEPDHLRPPMEDGKLTKGECVYGYVSGQKDTTQGSSPLVFDGFLNRDFTTTEYLPWLSKKKAIVACVDGSVNQNELTSGIPGGTIQSRDLRLKNIFLEIDKGGELATETKNVHLPIGY